MKRKTPFEFAPDGCWLLAALTIAAMTIPAALRAQTAETPALGRDQLIAAAREIMKAQTYCALITLDETGRPSVRTMNPFPPEDDMTVWIATNTKTRKVQQIRKDPRVTLYYADHANAIGYVAITGTAVLVDDMKEILKRKRAYWDTAFPGLKDLVLIKVIPEQMDVLNYKQGALADKVTWRTPTVKFQK